MSPEDARLGAVREGHRQRAPILDVDRIGLDEGALLRLPARRDVADVAAHVGYADRFAARFRLDLLQIKHRRQRMAAHADQRAAAGHRPMRRMRGMGAAVILLALHEQDLVPGGLQDFRRFGHRRRVDPVLRVHEEPAGVLDRRAGFLHLLQHALVHQRLWHLPADRRLIAFPPEIAGKRLFADHMLAGLHRIDDHRGVQMRGVQMSITSSSRSAIKSRKLRYAVGIGPARKIDDMVAPCRDRAYFNLYSVDAPVGMHVQFGHEAAARQTDPDFRHSRMPSRPRDRKTGVARSENQFGPDTSLALPSS